MIFHPPIHIPVPLKHTLPLLLSLSLAQCHLTPAWADAVDLPDAPPPAVEPGGPDASDLATSAPIGTDLAMLYTVPTAPDGAGTGTTPMRDSPLKLQSGTGQDTRLGVDLAAADKATDGWPWYAKAGVVVGCVALVALATWGIVEASHSGSHDNDSSTHYTIYGDDGATLNVKIGSPSSSSSSSSTSTSSSSSTSGSSTPDYW